MKIRKTHPSDEKIELQMTPMIDIVFQLLVFFIMTFKIVDAEGDFNVRMPLSARREGPPEEIETPPVRIILSANDDGSLRGIKLNDTPYGSFDALRNQILGLMGDVSGPITPGSLRDTTEAELDCDPNLHYVHVIEAVTAVTGYKQDENTIVPLIQKVKFSPPRK